MTELLIISLCLLLNALLAAFEMAFVTVSKGELRRRIKEGSKTAQWLLNQRENPERTLSTIQIGITLVGALAAAVGGLGAAENFKPWLMTYWGIGPLGAEALSAFLIVLPLTYLTVVLGELTPKSLALRTPLPIVLGGARWLALADMVLAPLVRFLEWSTKQILRMFFPKATPSRAAEEFREKTTIEIDSLSPAHQQAVLNLAYIENRQVQEIAVPWDEVTLIQKKQSMEDVVPVVFASGHTRLPVVDDENVVGVLHTKEFLAHRESGGREWQSLIRPILKLRSGNTLLPVFRLMQERRSHMAVVYASKNQPMGIVTLVNILEACVGEIYDEDDDSRIRKIFADRIKTKHIPFRSG